MPNTSGYITMRSCHVELGMGVVVGAIGCNSWSFTAWFTHVSQLWFSDVHTHTCRTQERRAEQRMKSAIKRLHSAVAGEINPHALATRPEVKTPRCSWVQKQTPGRLVGMGSIASFSGRRCCQQTNLGMAWSML